MRHSGADERTPAIPAFAADAEQRSLVLTPQRRRHSSDNAHFPRTCASPAGKEEALDTIRQQLWQPRVCFGLHVEKLPESRSRIVCTREGVVRLPTSRSSSIVA